MPGCQCVLTFAGGEGVAMAQIMNYYQYPKSGMGNVNYKNPGSTLLVSADFGHTTYDWENSLLLLMSLPLGMR